MGGPHPELAPRVAAVAASPHVGPALRDAFTPLLRQVAQVGGLNEALRVITFFGLGADGLETLFRDADLGAYWLRARARPACRTSWTSRGWWARTIWRG